MLARIPSEHERLRPLRRGSSYTEKFHVVWNIGGDRGWALKIDKGNLGLYDRAPSIYFSGMDGKGISARPAPEYKFKPDSWYHLVVAYDGSRLSRGINMYSEWRAGSRHRPAGRRSAACVADGIECADYTR